jgi:hypothetical protein
MQDSAEENLGSRPLKPLAVRAEINMGDVRAVAAARPYSFQARLQLVYVDGVIMRGNRKQLSVGADCTALHTRLAQTQTAAPTRRST